MEDRNNLPVTTRWWQQRTAWTAIGGAVAGWVPVWMAWANHGSNELIGAAVTAAIGITFSSLSSIFARQGGVEAATEVGRRANVIPPSVEEVKDKAP